MEARLDHLSNVILELTRNLNQSTRSIKTEYTQSELEVPVPKMIIKMEKQVGRSQTSPALSLQRFKKFQNSMINKVSKLEQEIHKNNLVIFGLDGQDAESAVGHLITQGLNIRCHRSEIQECYFIGKNKNRWRPIRVHFVSYKLCQHVFNSRHLVRQAGIKIYHDMPFEVRKQRKLLRKYIEENKVNGTLNYNKLMINGVPHTVESLGLEDDSEIIDDLLVKVPDTFETSTISNQNFTQFEENITTALDQNITSVDETLNDSVEAASNTSGKRAADIREDSPDVEVIEQVKRFRNDPDIIDLDSICEMDPDIIILD